MNDSPKQCIGCGEEIHGSHGYCPDCIQRAKDRMVQDEADRRRDEE